MNIFSLLLSSSASSFASMRKNRKVVVKFRSGAGERKKFTEESSYRQLAISYTDRLLFCFHFTPLSFIVGIVWGFASFWALLAAIFLPALNLFHLKFSVLSKYHHHHHLCRLIFNTFSLSLLFLCYHRKFKCWRHSCSARRNEVRANIKWCAS